LSVAIGALLIALLRRQPPALLAASVFGWIALLVLDRMLILPAICGGASAGFESTLAVTPAGPACPGVARDAAGDDVAAARRPHRACPAAQLQTPPFSQPRPVPDRLRRGVVCRSAAVGGRRLRDTPLLAQAIALPALVVAVWWR